RGGFVPRAWFQNGVVFNAPSKDSVNVWRLPLDANGHVAGEAEQLTFLAGRAFSGSPANGKLAFSDLHTKSEIYSLPIDANAAKVTGAIQRLTHNADNDAWPSLSRDGKTMVFLSDRLKHWDVWKKDFATGTETPLTNDASTKSWPEITADGA